MKPTARTSDAGFRFAERRSVPRFGFVAAVELIVPLETTHISGRVTEISQHGCFAEVDDLLTINAFVQLRIHKGGHVFETWARVIYSRPGNGVGLCFIDTALDQTKALERWLAEAARQA